MLRFCEENSLVLIAVETLQNTLLNENFKTSSEKMKIQDSEGKVRQKEQKIKSFRQVVNEANSQCELFSIYSLSKGPFYKYFHLN